MPWYALAAAAVTAAGSATAEDPTSTTSQDSTTEASQSSERTSTVNSMDRASKKQLDSLTETLMKKQSAGFDKQGAIDEYQGVISNIFDSMSKQYLPKVYNAQNQAGAYDSTASQLMANDVYAQSVAKSSQAVIDSATQQQQFDTKTTLDSLFNALGLQAQVTQSGTSKEDTTGTSKTKGAANSTGSAGGPFSGLFG